MTSFTVSSSRREALVDITEQVAAAAARHPQAAALLVFSPHTTCGILINEGADPDVAHDVLSFLHRLVPQSSHFRHVEGNADAHIKTIMVGSSVSVMLESGRLRLGTWQRIFLAEFDGPRRRNVWVQALAAAPEG
jgi:secondary thiamine-phosphate synthase enzyme